MPFSRPDLPDLMAQTETLLLGDLPQVSPVVRRLILRAIARTQAGMVWSERGYLAWLAWILHTIEQPTEILLCCGPDVTVARACKCPSDFDDSSASRRISGVVAADVICAVSGSCQAAAVDKRTSASANASWNGQADAIASLIRRTLMRTWAPIFSSLRRMVPQVASANCV